MRTTTLCRVRGSWTCSPERARWGSKPCRAAQPSRCWWTYPPPRAGSSGTTSTGSASEEPHGSFAATRLGPAGRNGTFGLVFCDPPYGRGLAGPALICAAGGGWLDPGALVLVEERAGAFVMPPGFAELERRGSGDTELIFGRFEPA